MSGTTTETLTDIANKALYEGVILALKTAISAIEDLDKREAIAFLRKLIVETEDKI